MAEMIPAPLGVMGCTRCGAVVMFTAADAESVERNDGKAWRPCGGCGRSSWFVPFDPSPRRAPEAPHA